MIWFVSWLLTTILTRINHSNNVSLQQILEMASVGINASLDTLDEWIDCLINEVLLKLGPCLTNSVCKVFKVAYLDLVSLSMMFDDPIIYIFVGHVYVVFLWNKFTDIKIKCQIWVKNMQEYKIKLSKSNELGKTIIL